MRRLWISGVVAVILFIGAAAWMGTRPLVDEGATAADFDTAPVRMRIDVSERRLYVEEDGEVIQTYDVAVGKPGHATPRGSYSVRRVIWNPRWVPPKASWAKGKKPVEAGDPRNPMGRVKVFFREPDYYIHGTNDEASIGSAASHGCVRMRNEDIIALSTLLLEKGDAPVSPGLIQTLINRVRQTRELRLALAVPLRVQN